MKCVKCGAILLDNDTFCSECGEKVQIGKCPACGEKLREGVKFCSKCGYKLGSSIDEINKGSDEDIPVTGGMNTVDIPFDLIEKNIIMEVEKQVNSGESKVSTSRIKNTINNSPSSIKQNAMNPVNNISNNLDDSYSDEEDDYYEDEEIDEYYEDEYSEDDEYIDDDYPDEYDDYYEEEVSEKGTLSRLFTAGLIIVGLIIVLLIAALFFNNRKTRVNEEIPEITQEEELSENQSEEEYFEENIVNDGTIGTITIISDVNIRKGADKNTDRIGTARVGEEYSYYGFAEDKSNWVHIKIDDNTDGYVYKDYVKINE